MKLVGAMLVSFDRDGFCKQDQAGSVQVGHISNFFSDKALRNYGDDYGGFNWDPCYEFTAKVYQASHPKSEVTKLKIAECPQEFQSLKVANPTQIIESKGDGFSIESLPEKLQWGFTPKDTHVKKLFMQLDQTSKKLDIYVVGRLKGTAVRTEIQKGKWVVRQSAIYTYLLPNGEALNAEGEEVKMVINPKKKTVEYWKVTNHLE